MNTIVFWVLGYAICLAVSFIFAYFMPRFHGCWQADLFGILSLLGLVGAVALAPGQFPAGVTLVFVVAGIVLCLFYGDKSAERRMS